MTTLICLLVFSFASYSDIAILKDGHIFSAPAKSKWFSDKVTADKLKTAQFLEIKSIEGEASYASFRPATVGPAPKFTWLDKPSKANPKLDEGCTRHPMEWLTAATQVAKLEKPLDEKTLHIEIPADFKVAKADSSFEKVLKTSLEAPDSEEDDDGSFKKKVAACMKTVKYFERDSTKLAYVDCDDDLNEIEYIFIKENNVWAAKEIESFTLTDNCP